MLRSGADSVLREIGTRTVGSLGLPAQLCSLLRGVLQYLPGSQIWATHTQLDPRAHPPGLLLLFQQLKAVNKVWHKNHSPRLKIGVANA